MSQAARHLLPKGDQTLLLRACLGGEDRRAAWVEWSARHPDPIAGMASDGDQGRLLAPLLGFALDAAGIEPADSEVAVTLRAVMLREERRASILHRGVGAALAGLAEEGIDATVVGGVDFAERSWPRAGLRHTHDLDLLVPEDEVAPAAAVLRRLGGSGPSVPGPRGDLQMTHAEGAPVALHTKLFPIRGPVPPMGKILARREETEIAGARTRVLARADAVARTIAIGLCGPRPGHLKWVPDVQFALTGAPPDWDRLFTSAEESQLSVACSIGIGYLAAELELDVPEQIRARLTRARQGAARSERDVIVLAAMRALRARRLRPDLNALPGTGLAVARRLPLYMRDRLAGRR